MGPVTIAGYANPILSETKTLKPRLSPPDAAGCVAPVVSGRPWWLDDPTFRVVPFFAADGGLDLPRAGPDHRWVIIGFSLGGSNFTDQDSSPVYPFGGLADAGVGSVYLPFLADRGVKLDESQNGWVAVIKPPHGSVIPSAACYFTFDTDSVLGDCNDATANGRNGSGTDTAVVGPGAVGVQALSGGSFIVSDTGVADDSTAWTVAAWVKVADPAGRDGTGTQVIGNDGGDGNISMLVVNYGGGGTIASLTTLAGDYTFGPTQVNAWVHLVLLRDAGSVRLYVNGELKLAASSDGSHPTPLQVELNGDYADPIDEVGVWDTALTPAAIAALAAGQRPPNVPQP